jgi:RNA ligase (TIGR02306 family)
VSTLKVTIERLTIHPHSNADALELAQVGGYRAVVPKGQYQTGDYAVYIPEQAVLPDPLIEELGLVGRLAGKAKNRVKAIRLRGEVSQGIVCRPSAMAHWWSDATSCALALTDAEEGDALDFASDLGIEKWVPEIPAHMNGQVEAAPSLIRWVDIENLQRYPDIFQFGEEVVATEKIHGTACLVTYERETDTLLVSSKGHGEKNLALVESDTNLYWRAARAYELKGKAAAIAERYNLLRVGIFGEVFGAGVQDLAYGASTAKDETLGYRVFDIKVGDALGLTWVNANQLHNVCAEFDLPPVPLLYSGPFDLEALKAVASGTTKIGGGNIREGVVIRPAREGYSPITGGRAIAKLISPAYLLRKGDVTEYE